MRLLNNMRYIVLDLNQWSYEIYNTKFACLGRSTGFTSYPEVRNFTKKRYFYRKTVYQPKHTKRSYRRHLS